MVTPEQIRLAALQMAVDMAECEEASDVTVERAAAFARYLRGPDVYERIIAARNEQFVNQRLSAYAERPKKTPAKTAKTSRSVK